MADSQKLSNIPSSIVGLITISGYIMMKTLMLPAVLHVSRQLSAMPFPAKHWKKLLLLKVKVFTNMNCNREAVERVITIPSQVKGSVHKLFALPKVLNEQEKNSEILTTIVSNISYLARQGSPLRGDWN